MSTCPTPRCATASTTAFWTAGFAPIVPDSVASAHSQSRYRFMFRGSIAVPSLVVNTRPWSRYRSLRITSGDQGTAVVRSDHLPTTVVSTRSRPPADSSRSDRSTTPSVAVAFVPAPRPPPTQAAARLNLAAGPSPTNDARPAPLTRVSTEDARSHVAGAMRLTGWPTGRLARPRKSRAG